MAKFIITWDGLPAGTLVASETEEHRYYGCFTELRGTVTEINWTDDGTTTGTTLFGTTIIPWVEVQITPLGDLRDFTQDYYGGPMYNEDKLVNAFAWVTGLDPDTSSYWVTTVYRAGQPDYVGARSQSAGSTVFLHAVGDKG